MTSTASIGTVRIGNVGTFTGAFVNGSASNSTATITDTSSGTAFQAASDITGGVQNYGVISSATGIAANIITNAQTSAAFTNQSTGVITSGNATTTSGSFYIGVDISNSLLNYGTITNSAAGNALYVSAAMTGAIVNGSGSNSTATISDTSSGTGLYLGAKCGRRFKQLWYNIFKHRQCNQHNISINAANT